MVDVTPSDLAAQIADYVAKVAVRDGLFYSWMTGAADGGVNHDGVFPLTDLSGFTRYLESPAKIMAMATTGFASRFATKADLDGADANGFIPGTMVLVYADPDTAKNGPYVRVGGSGWQYAQWFYDSLAQVVGTALTSALAQISAATTASTTSLSSVISTATTAFNDLLLQTTNARDLAVAARDLAIANSQLPANNSNPNLSNDPEIEYLNVDAVQSWSGSNMTVVVSNGAKRLRTPSSASALAMIDSPTRMVPVSAFPNGRVSASIIISQKAATSDGALRVRLYALDANGGAVNWPDVSTSDYPAEPGYFTRKVPTAAITTPTELIVAQNVAIPAGAAKIGWFIRVETTVQMDVSHLTIRNGADPHYRSPPLSPKALSDTVSLAAAASSSVSALALARSLIDAASYSPNLYSDPEYEYLSVGAAQSWSGIGFTVVTQGGAKRLRTPAASGSALGALDTSTIISGSAFPSGRVSASVIIARKDISGAASDLRFRLIAKDSSGNQLVWPDVSKSDETTPNYYSRYAPTAAITVPTELVIAENIVLPTNTATLQVMVRIDSTPTMDFSHLSIRDGADPHYRAVRVSPKSVADALTLANAALNTASAIGSDNSNPNLYTDPDLEYYSVGDNVSFGGTNFPVVLSGGAKRMRTPSVSAPTGLIDLVSRRIPISSFPSGLVSASIIVARKDASAAATDIRFRLYAYDASGTQLVWPTVAGQDESGQNLLGRYIPAAAITKPTEIIVAKAVALPANTATIGIGVRLDTTATMDFAQITVRNGSDPHYVPPKISPKQVADYAAAIASLPPEDAADIAAQLPNRFTADELDVKTMRYASGNVNSLTATTTGADQRPCWSVVAPTGLPSEFGSFFGAIPRSDLSNGSGFFSAAVQIYGLDSYNGTGSAAAQTCRVLVIQRNSSQIEITGTRVTLSASVTGPGWLRQAGIALHADTAFVVFYIAVNNVSGSVPRALRFGDMLLAPGSNAIFRRPVSSSQSSSGGGGGVLFISPTGVDTAAGTQTAPMFSAQAAVNKMNGAGTIIALFGTYSQSQMRIAPSTLTGKLTILGRRSSSSTEYDNYPVVYCADKLTGITKTSGFTKVYQVHLTTPPTLANFNWAYQDGVADPRTVIPTAERSPQHRGRPNRLHWATKLVKTTASTLAAAQAEIDASDNNDPKAFIDDSTGIMYFSIVGGGDGSAANIYLDNTQGLFSTTGSLRESAPELLIMGLEVRYGGIDCSFFRRAHLDEVFVFGAATNCVYYSVLSFGTLECACSGSQAGLVGDGLNGHIGAKITDGSDYYGHDCRDDGYSDHEGSSTRLHGGLVEYNGGTGCAPAYGCDDIIINVISRKNQQRGTYKKAGMYATGAPTAGASGGDGGVDTRVVFINCISIGDIIGFADDRSSTSNTVITVCINCKVYDQTGAYGYDVAEMRDCGWSGTVGIARRLDGGATIVKNTALVS